MSSIRPLVTITIVVAVGVFMFMKINEGPAPMPAEIVDSLDQSPLADVPPLTTELAPTPLPAAPAWNDPASGASEGVASLPTVPPTSLAAEMQSPTELQSLEAIPVNVPPIPELPPVTSTTEAMAPLATAASLAAAQSVTPPATVPPAMPAIPLPANIPVAQYPGDATATAPIPAPVAASTTTPTPAPTMEAMSPPAALSSHPFAQESQQLPDASVAETAAPAVPPIPTPVTAGDDRYGATSAQPGALAAEPMAPPAAATALESVTPVADPNAQSFATVWPEIQAALERQQLVEAHTKLSRLYGNPNFTPAEAQQIESLLGQLAGTVVYSTEHRLEPPYTVHAGDTLQTIAEQYEVPWQLLAKINGIPAANMVQPGQQLKVIHGPFAAVVELDKSQLTLMLDGRYAGRFPISVEQGVSLSEGQWVLEQKLVQPTTQDSAVVSASYTPSAVERVLVLRNESPAAGGATIAITGGPSTPSGPKIEVPEIQLSPRDVEELADILSVGSPVTIRR